MAVQRAPAAHYAPEEEANHDELTRDAGSSPSLGEPRRDDSTVKHRLASSCMFPSEPAAPGRWPWAATPRRPPSRRNGQQQRPPRPAPVGAGVDPHARVPERAVGQHHPVFRTASPVPHHLGRPALAARDVLARAAPVVTDGREPVAGPGTTALPVGERVVAGHVPAVPLGRLRDRTVRPHGPAPGPRPLTVDQPDDRLPGGFDVTGDAGDGVRCLYVMGSERCARRGGYSAPAWRGGHSASVRRGGHSAPVRGSRQGASAHREPRQDQQGHQGPYRVPTGASACGAPVRCASLRFARRRAPVRCESLRFARCRAPVRCASLRFARRRAPVRCESLRFARCRAPVRCPSPPPARRASARRASPPPVRRRTPARHPDQFGPCSSPATGWGDPSSGCCRARRTRSRPRRTVRHGPAAWSPAHSLAAPAPTSVARGRYPTRSAVRRPARLTRRT